MEELENPMHDPNHQQKRQQQEEDAENKKEKRVCRTLAILVFCFTSLFTVLGLTCYLSTDVPLTRDRIHGEEALLLYKGIRWVGVVMLLLPYALDLLLIFFLAILWCCGMCGKDSSGVSSGGDNGNGACYCCCNSSSSASASAGCGDGVGRDVVGVEWSKGPVEPPKYEQVVELVKVLSEGGS